MPRVNSQTWAVGDQGTAARWQDFNEDIDDLYSQGSDRLRVVRAVSGTALKIDIGSGSARVGNSELFYAGGLDISVTDSAANYVQIDSLGAIQINTSAWNTTYARLAKVTCAGGAVTAIELWNVDAFGGDIVGGGVVSQIIMWPTKTAPAGWLLCYGQAVSRSTYSALFDIICASIGTFTVTSASPAVFTKNGHGLTVGDAIYFTTTGALYTGLTANTVYYVIAAGLTADAFQVSASRGGAAIDTSGSQSGVHTVRNCPYGIGDGTTTFNIPDFRSRAPFGHDLMGGGAATARTTTPTLIGLGETAAGKEKHILTVAEMPAHTHTVKTVLNAADPGSGTYTAKNGSTEASGSAGSDGAHNNMPPYLGINFIIRYQ